jgi:uncharacterized protein (DUF1499 family)
LDRARLIAVGLALILCVLAPLYVLAAAFAVKLHLLSVGFGFGAVIAKGAPIIFGAALLVSVIACLLAFLVQPRGGRATALICLGFSLACLGILSAEIASAKNAPPLHDISTDLADRPSFSKKIAALRSADSNSLEVSQSEIDLQRKHYPNIKRMPFAVAPDAAFDATLQALQEKKVSIVNADKSAGIIEAATETPWVGIKQDIIVRIRSTDTGCIIDIRSASRTGASDFGANAKTIKMLLRAIKSQLSGA